MARKNHNEQAMREYFIENFDTAGQYAPETYGDLKDRVGITLDEYARVMDYPANIRKFPNIADRIADHMMGLPAPFHPEYENYKIEEQLREWGIIQDKHSNSAINRMIGNYFRYWAVWMLEQVK